MSEATSAAAASPSPFAGGDWFDPLEEAVRRRVRAFIEELLEEELEVALGRGRYERDGAAKGHRHGRRPRRLGTRFGPLELTVPSRCHLSPGRGSRRRISFAKPWPNLRPHCRMVSWLTVMPRAASISSTIRRPSGKRK